MIVDVVGLGVSTLDILTLVEHFPAGDDVQPAAQISIQGGGPIATAMITLARLGARTVMLDCLGDDWRGVLIREAFSRAGVSTDLIRIHEGAISPSASVWVKQHNGERAIAYSTGSVPEYHPEDLPFSLIDNARFLHVNGRHPQACRKALERAKASGVQVSFDGGAQRYRPELNDLLSLCDICIYNEEFARAYTGKTDLAEAAAQLLAGGARLVVITAGLRGSWIFTQTAESFHQPAYPFPHTIDTTGCGDAYHGGFLYGLVQNYPLRKCAALASAVAAINSQHLGGQTGLPTLAEVKTFLSSRSVLLE